MKEAGLVLVEREGEETAATGAGINGTLSAGSSSSGREGTPSGTGGGGATPRRALLFTQQTVQLLDKIVPEGSLDEKIKKLIDSVRMG